MKLFTLVVLPLTLAATTLSAQAPRGEGGGTAAVGTLHSLWEEITGHIATTAQELPESLYAYRPTPEVRSFGQLIGHVAGAQRLICAAALGEPGGAEDDIERTRTTKAALLEALRESTAYCQRAYTQTDAAAQQRTRLFGEERTRLYALALNATHNGEHYGNLITYLRLNGRVPPSSRRGP